jgi:hypothetical protein
VRPNFVRLSAPDQRAGIGHRARAGFDRDGLAGEHRLVQQDLSIVDFHIRGSEAAQRQLDHVPLRKLRGGDQLPDPVAPHRGGDRKPRLQGGEGRLGAPLLEIGQGRVEKKKHADDGRLDVFAHEKFERDRAL